MADFPQLADHLIVGIETRRKGDGLQCYFCGKSYGSASGCPDLNAIATSFGLPVI